MRAGRTHPGGVLLSAAFTTAELADGRWAPIGQRMSATPQGARDRLAMYLRVTAPWQLDLGPGERAVHAAAANRLDAERVSDLAVAGRRFQVARVERLVRFGPDGPEGPRPSDPDPQPPVMVQEQQSREHGLPVGEDKPIELDADARRFIQLFREEEEQRKARLEQR